MKVDQSCPILWDPMDYIVHGILQAWMLEWVAFPFSRESSQPRDQTQVSCTAGRFFPSWATREAQDTRVGSLSLLQQIFLTQELNRDLLHYRQILYQLSYQGSQTIYSQNTVFYISPSNTLARQHNSVVDKTATLGYSQTISHFSLCLSVQSLSCVQLFETPWTAACQASLSVSNSRSLLKLMSIEWENFLNRKKAKTQSLPLHKNRGGKGMESKLIKKHTNLEIEHLALGKLFCFSWILVFSSVKWG